MTDLADEIERRVRDMGRSPRPENDATSLGFWVAGQLQSLLTALRASRPEPAADAVEAAYREGYRTCWHFNVATDDPADEEIIGIEWRDSEAKKALSALPRPEADEGAVPFPATFEEFTNKLRRWCELAEKGQLSWPAAGREIVRDADTLRAALAAAQEGQR